MKIEDIKVEKIRGLERDGIYWVQVNGKHSAKELVDIGCYLDIVLKEYDIKVIVSSEDISFINMPKELELRRVE